MKTIFRILLICMFFSSCDLGVMVDRTSMAPMYVKNNTKHVLELTEGNKVEKIQPYDSIFYYKIIDKEISSLSDRLEYALKNLCDTIKFRQINNASEYVGDVVIYTPNIYKDDSGDNNYFNINSWKKIDSKHSRGKVVMYTYK